MEAILVTVKDLAKYKIVSNINTGDKTLDSLYVALSATILTVVFTVSYWKAFLDYLKLFLRKFPKCSKRITYESKPSLQLCLKKDRVLLKTMVENLDTVTTTMVDIKKNRVFLQQLYYYLVHENLISSCTYFVPELAQLIPGTNDISSVIQFYIKNLTPVFIYNQEIISIYNSETGSLVIQYQSLEGLLAFKKALDKYKIPEIFGDFDMKIFNSDDNKSYPLYSDRTFDGFVSLHKPYILNSLKDFSEALEGKSKFNGFGTYNLGIILYGKPGTGKTSIIKAVCNYLKRNAMIVDLRNIKTISALQSVFGYKSDVLNNVFVFEEFDSVQGVISRDSLDKAENKEENVSEKKELREQYFKLLELKTKTNRKKEDSEENEEEEKDNKKKKKDKPDEIEDELKELKRKIRELDEALTCDNILTVLDGMQEYRGRVIIATTNYIDRIDKALLREGRFDLKIHLEPFVTSEIKELLTKMYKDKEVDFSLLDKVKFPEKKWTPVQIINLCHKFQAFEKVVEILSQN